jgi:hypothetical protein
LVDQKTNGNCESETQPEFIAEHGNGVPGVTVVAAVNVGHFVTGVRVGRLMIIVAHACDTVMADLRELEDRVNR